MYHPGFNKKLVRICCTDDLLIISFWLILLTDFTGLLAAFAKTMVDVSSSSILIGHVIHSQQPSLFLESIGLNSRQQYGSMVALAQGD